MVHFGYTVLIRRSVYLSVLLYVHLKKDVFSLSLLSLLYHEGDDIINNELKEDKVEGDLAQGTSGMKPGCPKVNIVEGEPALGSKGMKPGITKDDSKKIYQI